MSARPEADPYGHAAAAVAGMEMFELGARRTGRTSRLLEQVQDGDRIICLDRDRRLLEQQLRDVGKTRVSVGSCPPDPALLLKKFGTMPRGRTFVDHEWCRAYFALAVCEARRDLATLLAAMSKTWPDAPPAPRDDIAERMRDFALRNTSYGV
jgi:hypothetical protein